MELDRLSRSPGLSGTLLPLDSPGEVSTFYAYEGGPGRNGLLAAMALQLAGDAAQAPVLVIDWDLAAPSLHGYFDALQDEEEDPHPPGLVEYMEALREQLRQRRISRDGAPADLADALLDAVDWRPYTRRADGRYPLYLMRAGRFDDGYVERAGRLDWDALFDACPALLRRFAARMARHFRHVLVAGGSGRSSGVSACTALVPDHLVGLFTPSPGSLDGLEGVVRRAIEYRCTHEDEQRPLLVYPVACAADGARSDPAQRWRRGDPAYGLPGYQPRLEDLLRGAYGLSLLGLEHWFDEVQLPLYDAVAIDDNGGSAARRALARPARCLLSWFVHGSFPWQSQAEVRLRLAIGRSRAGQGATAAVRLAGQLAQLAMLCRKEGRQAEAAGLLGESLALRRSVQGEEHPEARAALAALAALHFAGGKLDEARRSYEQLAQLCARGTDADDPETLAARSGLARVLGRLRERERALALHEQVVATCERRWGDTHPATLDSLEDLAVTLREQHENDRALVLFERVLDGRRRLQGGEHEDTLRCGQRLAQLLGKMGDLGNARRLLEAVLRGRVRQDGPYAAPTVQAREALTKILAAQGDMAAVRGIHAAHLLFPERAPGAAHPDEHPVFDSLQHKCAQLKDLIDRESQHEARALADSLAHSVQWPSVALPLRKRVTAMIEQVYLQEGDKDAALAFNKGLVSSLEGALFGSEPDNPQVLR